MPRKHPYGLSDINIAQRLEIYNSAGQLGDMLYLFRIRSVLLCGINGIDRFKKRVDFFIERVKVRAYSNDVRFIVFPFPVIHFKLSRIECLFNLVSVREMNRNSTTSTGIILWR